MNLISYYNSPFIAPPLQPDDPTVPRSNPTPTIALHRHSLHLRGPTASTQPRTVTASTQKESTAEEKNSIKMIR